MKIQVLCVIFTQVLILSTSVRNIESQKTNLYNVRSKRDPLGLRGPFETTDEDQNTNVPDSTTTIPLVPNPCLAPPTSVPDFSAPGRRINEAKCFEYINDIKATEEEEERQEKCLKWKLEHEGVNFTSAIGGRDALPGEFPHMGGVGWKAVTGSWIFKCGSSLISRNFVLTAGHCTEASDGDTSVADIFPKIVRLGDINIDTFDIRSGSDSTDVNIKRIIQHPQYKPPKKYFDIALFELEDDVIFTKFIRPACLYTDPENLLIGQNATLTGWGVVETVNKTTSPILQAAYVNVIDSQQCDDLLRSSCNRHWCGLKEHQLCAGVLSGGVDACQGDSGGPLQMRMPLPNNTKGLLYHVIGVNSFGIGCALPNLPSIYTRVSSFIDWIEKIMWI